MCVEEPEPESSISSNENDLPDVPTPLKTCSSMNESFKDQNVLQRAIGEFAEERSTAKKKKNLKDNFKKQGKMEILDFNSNISKEANQMNHIPVVDLQRELTFNEEFYLE
jgi:hypothetical protein